MRAAPEMVPSLDDALLALDGFPGRVPDIGLAVRFLEQLNSVRDVPAVIPDQLQAAALEGAYQAGFRCADESGHVLVVSLPDLLKFTAEKTVHSERTYVFDPLGSLARWAARLFRPSASACTQDCDQGRACSCAAPAVGYALGPAALAFDNDELDQWKARALAAEKTIRDEQFARLFAAPYGEKQHG